MSALLRLIAEIGIELHPDRVNAIAKRVETLSSAADFEQAHSSFGPSTSQDMIDSFGRLWEASAMTPNELATALRSASMTAGILECREQVEMVWTGPFTGLVPSRHTEQVLLDIIQSARWRLFLVSFVSYTVESIKNALNDAIARNVKVNVLLESSQDHGGRLSVDSIRAFKQTISSANVYAWSSESKASHNMTNGCVHAKCAVADGTRAFITSANLTQTAMENNMELGVLIRGGNLPEKLTRHLEALISTQAIEIC